MQYRDPVYEALLNTDHSIEVKVSIAGVEYGEDQLIEVRTNSFLFADDNLSIGGALNGSVSIRMYSGDVTAIELSRAIPRAAEIILYECLTGRFEDEEKRGVVGIGKAGEAIVGSPHVYGDTVRSPWMPQGIYYIDTRDATEASDILSIDGLDRMVLAEADFPSDSTGWPKYPKAVVEQIASEIGVTVEPETLTLLATKNNNDNYKVQLPSTFTMRETLGGIAAMFCGNFIISKDGFLTLRQINTLPAETNYLINEAGSEIVVGGVKILV